MRIIDEEKKRITMMVASQIRSARIRCELSQEETAFRAGVNPSYYGQLERGLKCPTIDTLNRIAYALNTNLESLVRPDFRNSEDEEQLLHVRHILSKVPKEKLNDFLLAMEHIANLL